MQWHRLGFRGVPRSVPGPAVAPPDPHAGRRELSHELGWLAALVALACLIGG